ncbi:Hypothetical protein CpP54B96_1469 [Corynebacterium pseudotuberculosis P54B96]|nr:Hypothetical protein CpP54B96_1469 [Corynebacterium pseudotuberculosis P54B96]
MVPSVRAGCYPLGSDLMLLYTVGLVTLFKRSLKVFLCNLPTVEPSDSFKIRRSGHVVLVRVMGVILLIANLDVYPRRHAAV